MPVLLICFILNSLWLKYFKVATVLLGCLSLNEKFLKHRKVQGTQQARKIYTSSIGLLMYRFYFYWLYMAWSWIWVSECCESLRHSERNESKRTRCYMNWQSCIQLNCGTNKTSYRFICLVFIPDVGMFFWMKWCYLTVEYFGIVPRALDG